MDTNSWLRMSVIKIRSIWPDKGRLNITYFEVICKTINRERFFVTVAELKLKASKTKFIFFSHKKTVVLPPITSKAKHTFESNNTKFIRIWLNKHSSFKDLERFSQKVMMPVFYIQDLLWAVLTFVVVCKDSYLYWKFPSMRVTGEHGANFTWRRDTTWRLRVLLYASYIYYFEDLGLHALP